MLHAHNCYPYHGEHADRIDRALATGTPVVIEQDLIWTEGRSVVGHNCPCTGEEPTLEQHFFERVRPIVEQALADPKPDQWPLLILHLDLKTEEPEHLGALSALLEKYKDWLTTAKRTATPEKQEPLNYGPVMVINEGSAVREKAFHDDVPLGGDVRIFGILPPTDAPMTTEPAPQAMVSAGANNYRRWWNLSWHAVEEGGQTTAGDWTPEDDARLRALVDYGHSQGVFVRFYCLNGHPADDPHGWSPGYNFGSLEAVQQRWRAAKAAGVDWLATDQYEELAKQLAR
ncbi:MAG: hypothetical protein KDC27_17535 [Acidobacteria bacterium]|nr:hypothetical protein [Acidobacteriota bacterium]